MKKEARQKQIEGDARIGVVITIVSMVFLGYLFIKDNSSNHLGNINTENESRNGTAVVSNTL